MCGGREVVVVVVVCEVVGVVMVVVCEGGGEVEAVCEGVCSSRVQTHTIARAIWPTLRQKATFPIQFVCGT